MPNLGGFDPDFQNKPDCLVLGTLQNLVLCRLVLQRHPGRVVEGVVGHRGVGLEKASLYFSTPVGILG